MIILVCDLIMPGTIVFNLPDQPRATLRMAQKSHRQILFCGPVPGIVNFYCFGTSPDTFRLCHRKSKLFKRISAPVQLFLPPIMRNIQKVSISLNSRAGKGGQVRQYLFLLSLIRYMVDKSCHRHSVIKLYVGLYTDSGKRVFLPDLKHSPGFILCILHILIFQITSGGSHHIFISMPLIWTIIASQFQLHQRKSFIHHPAFILLPAFLYGHILCLWNGRKV